MKQTTKTNEGRVNVALGPAKLAELDKLAKKNGTSKGGLARAFILDGMERMKSGEIAISAGVNITPKS
jgi:hypothetical protein